MELDSEMVDAALTTTRAVRRRLDFDRPLADQLLLDCIDVAEQAPTGGNQSSRRWLIVRDTATKEALGELYRSAGGAMIIDQAKRISPDHPNARNVHNAAHLAENIHRAPALVIPTILGRHDDSGRPGLFDSVIQSAWSFCVALRARGLGTTWTTIWQGEDAAVRELLGVPEDVTPIVMFPVAYTLGTDFSPGKGRLPAKDITYFDRWANVVAGERSEPLTIAAAPGVVVEVDISARPEAVWAFVADPNLSARFSDEFQHGEWGPEGAVVGGTLLGKNENSAIGAWETTSHITEFEPARAFAYKVTDPDNPAAQWRYDLVSIPGGTRLRYRVILGPGPSGLTRVIEQMPEREAAIIRGRQRSLRTNMQAVVDGIKTLAEER